LKKIGLLDVIAKQHRTYISNLRLQPELKWAALGDLYRLPDKEKYPLKEWEEAVSYLLGCEVHFNSYEEIGKSLKPFSLQVR
jgi:hypothetical protein